MPFSDEMIKRVAEAYRKIRNTCRYLLSNLYDFDAGRDAVAEGDLEEIDRYALAYHRQLVARLRDVYERFEFHLVYHELVGYCAAELSSSYFDVLKDRLYCEAASSRRRRSAQTVLWRILQDLSRLMAPVLPFTADEVWRERSPGSVHAAVFPPKEQWDEAVVADWQSTLLRVREAVYKKLEEARASRLIGSGLEAAVAVTAPAPLRERLRRYEASGPPFPGNLANLFIVSRVELAEGAEPSVRVSRAPGAKCERCWTYSENVGRLRHPGVCERCDQVLASLEAR